MSVVLEIRRRGRHVAGSILGALLFAHTAAVTAAPMAKHLVLLVVDDLGFGDLGSRFNLVKRYEAL